MTYFRRAAALLGVLPILANAGTFPEQPTTFEPTFLTVTYSCPYPLEGSLPQIEVDGEDIRVIVTLRGNICFDGEFPELQYAFELGELPEGDYNLELRHVTDTSQGRFIPPVFQQDFTVVDQATTKTSGLWSDETGLGQTLSVTMTDEDEGLLTWQTYDSAGDPYWIAGPFTVDGRELVAAGMRSFRGMRYPSFDPSDQRATPWGSVVLEILGCDSAVLRARSDVPGFRSAAVFLSKLGSIAGLEGCTPDSDAIVTLE